MCLTVGKKEMPTQYPGPPCQWIYKKISMTIESSYSRGDVELDLDRYVCLEDLVTDFVQE